MGEKKAPARAKNAAKTGTRRPALSFKDVQIRYLMDGVEGIQALLESGQVARATVRRAMEELKASGKSVADLERWAQEHLPSGGRGRSAPSAGEVRTYKAQQVKASGPFLRLPLDVLGVGKGGAVRVTFHDDEIIISR